MTTSQYTFINRNVSMINGDSYKIELPEEINRIPNKTIEIISCVLESTNEYPFVLIRSDFQPSNYYSSDGFGPCLDILRSNTKNGPHWNYIESGYEQPKYVINNTNQFNITFLYGASQAVAGDPEMLPLIVADILNFSILFKITYPEQGAINKQYTSEIQPPGLIPYL